jgi:hypothetical protein
MTKNSSIPDEPVSNASQTEITASDILFMQNLADLPTRDEYIMKHLSAAKCGVCRKDWDTNDPPMAKTKECHHVFHRECLYYWFLEKNNPDHDKCPTCECQLIRRAPPAPPVARSDNEEEEVENADWRGGEGRESSDVIHMKWV